MSARARYGAGALAALVTLAGLALAAPRAGALPPGAPDPDSMTFAPIEFVPPAPERFELENGLVVYFLEDHALPLVSVQATVRAGAVDERADRAGLAALTGEVMRSGGTRRHAPEELDELLEDMASRVEISIEEERAVATASALARNFAATLDLFADLLRNPAFREEKLEIARGRAIEDLRRQNDNPRGVVAREFNALLYGRHPYGRTPSARTLRAIRRDDLVEFHARLFHPNDTILAVAGAVSGGELRGLLAASFGDWPRQTIDFPPVPNVPPIPAAGAPSVHHIEMDIPQSAIRAGHLGIDRYNEDRYAVAVMNEVLGRGGLTARLPQRLRVQEGIAYAAGSVFTLPRDTGSFAATTQTRADQTVRAVQLLIEEIARMRSAGLTAEEFADARSAILNRQIFRFATPAQGVEQIAGLEFNGYPRDQLQRMVETYRSMDIEQANAAARRYLHPDSLVILVAGKAAAFDTTLAVFGPVDEIELETVE